MMAGLLVSGMILLAGNLSPATAATPSTQNFVIGYGAAATAAPDQTLPGPLTAIASTPDGNGYWATTASGQVTAEGDAGTFGSVTIPLRAPIVGMSATPVGPRLLARGLRRRHLQFR